MAIYTPDESTYNASFENGLERLPTPGSTYDKPIPCFPLLYPQVKKIIGTIVSNPIIPKYLPSPVGFPSLSYGVAKYSIRGVVDMRLQKINKERLAFERMRNTGLLNAYRGTYVAVLEGKVIDSDEDKRRLAIRVYTKYGYRPIYMDKVDGKKPIRAPAPRRIYFEI